ncbi:HEPN domain-containing protein [Streptomyces sp. NPDC046712]|uniref:HEPN domain-containing protein n=1 Tax=Streptomyces sp. NPDC046712 TaxID=3154802 RepID=UPI0033EF3DBB
MDLVAGLRSDIEELKDALLDVDTVAVNPPDDLTRRQQLLITSFVILAHAHIEEFIEELFVSYVEARSVEITKDSIPHCFVRLSLHFSGDLIGQGAGKYPTAQVCETAKNLYRSKVVQINNGLKGANVTALAKPLGLHGDPLTDSCDRLFKALNTLGAKRGKMAHTSSSQSASETVYAGQAVVWVEDAVSNIGELVGFLDGSSSASV